MDLCHRAQLWISLLTGYLFLGALSAFAQSPSAISIRAARVLDGRGGVVENGVIDIAGSKITNIAQRAGPVTYDWARQPCCPV